MLLAVLAAVTVAVFLLTGAVAVSNEVLGRQDAAAWFERAERQAGGWIPRRRPHGAAARRGERLR